MALFYRVNDFYFWPGKEQEDVVESLEFSVKSNPLNPLSFYSFASTLLFSRIFNKAKKFFQQSENSIWIYPNCSTYPSVLGYLRVSTVILVYKYWTLAAVY